MTGMDGLIGDRHGSGRVGRIHIFPSLVEPNNPFTIPGEASVFVTIGAGETHVTVLDGEGACSRGWTAIFGWSALCSLTVLIDGREVTFDEETLVARALTGAARVYGRHVDTSAFLHSARELFVEVMDQILSRTIGSGAAYDTIVLAAPDWLHGVLAAVVDLRPHILPEIRDN
ncbi:hypothetical protein LAZ40_11705 [Cereibacter sphaeroides]|uniref:hypothetical protein n=1 Tax=Cereibacter sphaeroides TaxID=1063 RepID=UPI001F2DF125|nr:hypothetical protein [Cereibacter sphaeroides]MCE6959684.1 hypothetical protein [Cereibacter sphaeroides]MCE6974455.1 hypothetical protein [Cereibacter sphaeroides]